MHSPYIFSLNLVLKGHKKVNQKTHKALNDEFSQFLTFKCLLSLSPRKRSYLQVVQVYYINMWTYLDT